MHHNFLLAADLEEILNYLPEKISSVTSVQLQMPDDFL